MEYRLHLHIYIYNGINNMENINLLIVDDEINILETLKDIFEAHGYYVYTASSGKEAIEQVKERFYSIVIMDVKMPGMNGVEAFKEIKKLSPASEVIMMTGYSVDKLLEEALANGAYAVIYKPINIPKLNMIIEGVLKRISILLVDDSADDRATISDILLNKGYRINEAEDGYRGLELIQYSKYDLILLDVMMPGMDGIKTLEWIKEINPATAVIVISAHNEEELIGKAIKKGALAYLTKPVDIEKLLKIISDYRNNLKV